MKKVFIDGSAGTTGLRIRNRLADRRDIELMVLPDELRKDDSARADCINSADISMLCLPDDAARQAVSLAADPHAVIIDTSTAHRTDDAFVYGMPELKGYREKIAASKRIANPGCHASGFIALVAPLVENGIIPASAQLSCFSLTGYSGGGKKMIAEYEAEGRDALLDAPRMYGLDQGHKHLPEMQKVCGLTCAPVFCPIVAPFYSGMEVTVMLFRDMINRRAEDIGQVYSDYYGDGLIRFEKSEQSLMSAGEYSGYDDMTVTVRGNGDRILLVSRFDNLGKGASGAAIQNMNIAMGVNETEGLIIKKGEQKA